VKFVKAIFGLAFMLIVTVGLAVAAVYLIQLVLIPAAQGFVSNLAVIVGITEVIIAIAIGAEAFVGVSTFLWNDEIGTITT
jgi:hypothetical protein